MSISYRLVSSFLPSSVLNAPSRTAVAKPHLSQFSYVSFLAQLVSVPATAPTSSPDSGQLPEKSEQFVMVVRAGTKVPAVAQLLVVAPQRLALLLPAAHLAAVVASCAFPEKQQRQAGKSVSS